ncbi:MAG: UvrD-helicase domain-containing protein, partial [Gammaproteobacteria bacterium]
MKPLDVPGIKLSGQQLIEASAGTGKTHAIANLFLRLVLEHGLRAEQVLVVTFTKAATDELRGRIRQRLADALQKLEAPAQIASEADDAFRTLLASADRAPDRDKLLRHLRVQLSAMDEASVFTIHGFCQRALAESAFESGEPFAAELATDTGLLLQRAATDWWRRRFYRNPLLARLAAGHPQLCSPQALLACITPLVGRDLRIDFEQGDPLQHAALAARVRTAWLAEGKTLAGEIRRLTSEGMLSRADTTLRDDRVAEAVKAMDDFCADEDRPLPLSIAVRLGQAFIDGCLSAKAKKNGVTAPTLGVSALIDQLFGATSALAQSLIAEAVDFCRSETDRLKRRDAVLGFDDMIRRLLDALEAPAGEALASRLATRYPAALVDECQDTDAAQYAIFRRIYASRDDGCLLMIGDPKQAIYSFRGADVFAYLGAKRATAGEARHTLDTNWRSVQPLVSALNALFNRVGDQSFLYPDAIGFDPVKAAGNAERKPLHIDGQAPVPLLFDMAPAPDPEKKSGLHSKEEFQKLAATATAARIAGLLAAAQQGRATLGNRALELRDVAVLVRTHREGAQIQQALRDADIGSAIASQESVFDSDEAAALQQVLAAIVDPASERLLRCALVSDIWRMRAQAIEWLRTDEAASDALYNRIAGYHATWLTQGFMPMFRRWLHGEGIPGRLWQGDDGERAMTNLLQLAELLQAASREHPAPEALLKHLATTRAAGHAVEEHQLRLESDENLVQIVTLHKSKGLQYPVVFLPFLACARKPD